jgi:hypothetical protein
LFVVVVIISVIINSVSISSSNFLVILTLVELLYFEKINKSTFISWTQHQRGELKFLCKHNGKRLFTDSIIDLPLAVC